MVSSQGLFAGLFAGPLVKDRPTKLSGCFFKAIKIHKMAIELKRY